MSFLKIILISIIVALFSVISVNAQKSKPDTVTAYLVNEHFSFENMFDDSTWMNKQRISNFTQREPDINKPVSETTKVGLVYNESGLIIVVWCYQSSKNQITAKYMSRDFNYWEDDNFQIIISPFNDRRNGYMFVINPNGARADLMVYGGEEGNMDWNGVWDAKTIINDKGWFAAIYIPFNTLQFKSEEDLAWAINFQRNIAGRNEQALWQGWSRDFSIYAVVNAGILSGLKKISYVKKFELKPYSLVSAENDRNIKSKVKSKIGADLNINITPTLKLNLTANTDFAQVEADQIVVNLSRFNQYYPEKREFFLESYNLYQFYLGNSNNIFYTRTIGIENHRSVPIIAGARLFGKIGDNNIGFLTIQEGRADSVPTTNASVLRYKRDISSQSFIGFIVTNKINSIKSNTVFGIDGSYTTSEFLSDKNLVIYGNLAISSDNLKVSENPLSYRFFIDYPNDLIDNFLSISSIQENFRPELGFLNRANYESINWNLRIQPRWFNSIGIKRMLFKPWEVSYLRTQTTKQFESFYNETRPFGFELITGDIFEFNLQQNYERIDNPYSLTNNFTIQRGKYWLYRYEIQIQTAQTRQLWLTALYNRGDFFGGKINTIETDLGINFNSHLNIKNYYKINKVTLDRSKLIIHELASFINYAFSTKLDISLFSQWNSLDDYVYFNLRLHFIPEIGSELYLVYNQGYDEINRFNFWNSKSKVGVLKFVYRILF